MPIISGIQSQSHQQCTSNPKYRLQSGKGISEQVNPIVHQGSANLGVSKSRLSLVPLLFHRENKSVIGRACSTVPVKRIIIARVLQEYLEKQGQLFRRISHFPIQNLVEDHQTLSIPGGYTQSITETSVDTKSALVCYKEQEEKLDSLVIELLQLVLRKFRAKRKEKEDIAIQIIRINRLIHSLSLVRDFCYNIAAYTELQKEGKLRNVVADLDGKLTTHHQEEPQEDTRP